MTEDGSLYRVDAPVFQMGEPAKGSAYPSVFIYARVEDGSGNYLGRAYIGHYPFSDEEDEGGWEALRYGADYYMEGMGYADAADRETRIDCFSAAELLYLHAAEKGNAIAWSNLGYVYSYDRCEGEYYDVWKNGADAFPREERAYECFKKASEAGIPEATYKLGDMYKHGIGCEPNAQEAFACYTRAFELGREDDPVVWGSVALRLGDAYENGFGCEQSFKNALKWYSQAVTGLEIAVRAGEWFYKKALDSAKSGVVRCKQEDVG